MLVSQGEGLIAGIIPLSAVPTLGELPLAMWIHHLDQPTGAFCPTLAVAFRAACAHLPLLGIHIEDTILVQVQQPIGPLLLAPHLHPQPRLDGAG